ncbi:MAG: cell filamentation protein Fic [Bacteroidetes bacterium]|nr:MAG: cell filamentation protein Fic [Bacteroidota bacterium]
MEHREQKIIHFIEKSGQVSSKEILSNVDIEVSYATLKRILVKLVSKNYIATIGQGRGTKYIISPIYDVVRFIDMDEYYQKEIDERVVKQEFNFAIINETFLNYNVFTDRELQYLNVLQESFKDNISQLSVSHYKKEFERLAIDLSWKSSQIEGNTYSLLETERLLKEKETASGKTKEEAIMLLNHKEALDFILDNSDYLHPLQISKIEDIHSILTKELSVERNLRKRRVGISGTNYRPLDNEFQIKEALLKACDLINSKDDVFEKSLLALVLISYIQPFEDGNKRTARIVSNAILMNAGYCPLSFRTVDSMDYKKAMLLFYEQNNMYNFKKIFMNQFEFAVKTYF